MTHPTQPGRVPDWFDFLKEVPLFDSVEESVLRRVAGDFRERTYRKGDTIFHQGDRSWGLYIVRQGKVRIFHLTPNGEETTVNILTPRQVVGEFAMIDGQPRSASAKAITPCRLLEVYRDTFLRHLETIPGLALAMCRQLTKKARWTSAYAETIARLDTRSRLLSFILHFNEEFGRPASPDGRQSVLDLGLTQSDLASLVGANRGWVNTILGEWREEQLIDFQRGRIIILDVPRAEAVLETALAG